MTTDTILFSLLNKVKEILEHPETRPKLLIDGSFGEPNEYGKGISPAIDLNNRNVVVTVHRSEVVDDFNPDYTLWYRVGRVEDDKINWSGSSQYDKGQTPSISINDDGLVVEVHTSELTNDYSLWCRVGRVDGDKINWAGGNRYDNGNLPSIAINNDGLVVEVHASDKQDDFSLWCRIGRVDGDKIVWAGGNPYDNGWSPSIAITDDGLVVEVHQSEKKNDDSLWYRVGTVKGEKIVWGEGRQYDSGSFPAIAITDSGLVVEVHSYYSQPDFTHYYRVGTVEGDKINWGENRQYSRSKRVYFSSVTCNAEFAVETHSDNNTLSYLLSEIFRLKFDEKTKRDAIEFARQIRHEEGRIFKRSTRITQAEETEWLAITHLLRLWYEHSGNFSTDVRYVNGQETIYPRNAAQRQRVIETANANGFRRYGASARVDNQGSFTQNGIRYTRVAVQLGNDTFAQVIVPLNREPSHVNSGTYPIPSRRIRIALIQSQRQGQQATITPPPNTELPPPEAPAILGIPWIVVIGFACLL